MSDRFIEDGDYTVPVPIGPLKRAPAFPDDGRFYIIEQEYLQYFSNFSEANLGDEHPDNFEYTLVHETPLEDYGCGLAKFTRRWAKTPNQRITYQSHPHTFPGLTPGGMFTPQLLVPEGTLSAGIHTIEAKAAHGYSAGDFVFIRLVTPYLVDGATTPFVNMFFQVRREILSVPTSTKITVQEIPGISPQFISMTKASTGRRPFTKAVMSKIVFDYFLLGVDMADVGLLEIFKPTNIEDGAGLITDTYGFETLPTQDDYLTNVVGEWVVAENSIVRPWLGKIYERATRYVVAE